MYTKLAQRNMKRSLKDYTIYFVTLVFGICIFYTFNSIGSQKIMMKLSEYDVHNFRKIDELMGTVSIFIACILGFLIIYANNYLIKIRKKEFGIYLTLGMEDREISNMLLIETILIGVFSLGIGLFLGVFLSQGMSIFTAKLFHVKMESFKFTFSSAAFIKTILYFMVMYIIVFLFNTRTIKKLELIDLLTDGRKNEKIKVSSLKTLIIVFIIGIIFIATSYFIILHKNSEIIFVDITISIPIILCVIGTFLFFFSLSGVLLRVVQNNRKIYLKELNMFLLRQISSKINTTFVSMSLICLMLFMSICMLSGGFSISNTLNKNIDDLSQYDVTLLYGSSKVTMNEFLKNNINLRHYTESYVNYYEYYSESREEVLGIKTYLGEDEGEKYKSHKDIAQNSIISIMKLSDFNNVMKFSKKETITLNNGEYGVFGDVNELLPPIQKAMDKKTKIKVNGYELIPSKNPVIEVTIRNGSNKENFCTFIVRDEIVDGLVPGIGFLNLNFKGDKVKMKEEFLKHIPPLDESKNSGITCIPITKDELRPAAFGLGGIVSYLALYIGVIFLITSAVILALQQLSSSADNIHRYNLLRKMGVDDEMINKTILGQVSIYFMLPLSLALIHSLVGLKIAKIIVNYFGTGNVTVQLLITTLIFIIIYGGYFWATYIGTKKMVK
ncbi:ABC transporter permease [Clostridium lundense]|uniref:ABC transporter permease n=1 Tax=Clostridium lundense TaxID=319475 RepID=UPI00047F1DBB|nr:ABC transporter permease [Clostridium lundense]